jgi:soluble cytochrome b562
MIKSLAATLCCFLAITSLSRVNADTPLENSMKRLAKAYHQLSLDLKAPVDASKADYVALAATMKTEALKGKDLVPKKVATIPADQQAAMVAAYQKSMDDLSATIDTLSTALQAGLWDDARKAMDQLHLQENQGHKEFRMGKNDKAPMTTTPPPTTATPSPAAPVMVTPSQQSLPPQSTPPASSSTQ